MTTASSWPTAVLTAVADPPTGLNTSRRYHFFRQEMRYGTHANDPLEPITRADCAHSAVRASPAYGTPRAADLCAAVPAARAHGAHPTGSAGPTRATTAVRATDPAVARSLGRRAGSAD